MKDFQISRLKLWTFLFLASLLLLSACTPTVTFGPGSPPETDYKDSNVEIPSSLQEVSNEQCEEDIAFWKEGRELKEKYYDNGIFCFEYVGDRRAIMRKLGSNVTLAGYIEEVDGVSKKGVGRQLFTIGGNPTIGSQTAVEEISISYRPKGEKVYVTVYYLSLNTD